MRGEVVGPPIHLLRFFQWFCRKDLREEIEGDLIERYELFFEKHGESKANRLFFKEVVSLLRPGLVGNFSELTQINILHMIQMNKRLIGLVVLALAILSVPLIAMQFSSSWNWDGTDFLVMGFLLISTSLLCEWVLRKVKSTRARILLCGGILLCLLLIWAELAVGVFGTQWAGS